MIIFKRAYQKFIYSTESNRYRKNVTTDAIAHVSKIFSINPLGMYPFGEMTYIHVFGLGRIQREIYEIGVHSIYPE